MAPTRPPVWGKQLITRYGPLNFSSSLDGESRRRLARWTTLFPGPTSRRRRAARISTRVAAAVYGTGHGTEDERARDGEDGDARQR